MDACPLPSQDLISLYRLRLQSSLKALFACKMYVQFTTGVKSSYNVHKDSLLSAHRVARDSGVSGDRASHFLEAGVL